MGEDKPITAMASDPESNTLFIGTADHTFVLFSLYNDTPMQVIKDDVNQ